VARSWRGPRRSARMRFFASSLQIPFPIWIRSRTSLHAAAPPAPPLRTSQQRVDGALDPKRSITLHSERRIPRADLRAAHEKGPRTHRAHDRRVRTHLDREETAPGHAHRLAAAIAGRSAGKGERVRRHRGRLEMKAQREKASGDAHRGRQEQDRR
jgi:hypothetical protein